MKNVFKIVSCEPVQQKTNETGETNSFRKIILQELGGKYANKYLATTYGQWTTYELAPGDIIVASISFRVNEWDDKKFQDIVINDIVKLRRG